MTNSVFPGALDNIGAGYVRDEPSLASVLNAIESTIGTTSATPVYAHRYATLALAVAATPAGGVLELQPNTTYTLTGHQSLANIIIKGNGAKIWGGAAGINDDVLEVGASVVLEDVVLDNSYASGVNIVNLSTNATNSIFWNVTFTGPNAQGVNANTTGIANILVLGCTFNGVTYGVLFNNGSTDAKHVRIIGNSFTGINSDGVELNYSSATPYTNVGRFFSIVGNSFNTSGTGEFGVGISGAAFVTITGNTFDSCFEQAVHVEGVARHITITANTVNNTGGGVVSAGIYVINGQFITVTGNTIEGTTGVGILVAVQVGTQVANYTITGNVVSNSTSHGIALQQQAAPEYGVVENNVCSDNGGDGINILTTGPGATVLSIKDNTCTGNTGFGIQENAARAGMLLGPNSLEGNTTGDFNRAGGWPQAISGDTVQTSVAATGSATTPAANLTNLGSFANGQVTIVGEFTGANYSVSLYTINWDGTTLTATLVQHSDAGIVGGPPTLAMSGNILTATLYNAGGPGTMLFQSQFTGTIVR